MHYALMKRNLTLTILLHIVLVFLNVGATQTSESSYNRLLECMREEYRIEGSREAVNNTVKWEVNRFNKHVDRFNKSCNSIAYRSGEDVKAETQINREGVESLRAQGRKRINDARLNRLNNTYHIKSNQAELKSNPLQHSTTLGYLKQWEDVQITGRKEDGFWVLNGTIQNLLLSPSMDGYWVDS